MSDNLDYKIISQNGVVIVSFQGHISKESREKLQQCHGEILSFKSRTLIFYFKDVSAIDRCVHRDLTILQQEMRASHPKFFLSGLMPNLKTYLAQQGIIRLHEVKNSLKDALDAA